jgi:thiol:disulfide interchange protein
MEKFKIAMGFPMLATAIWLLNLTVVHYGKRVLWLGIFLVLLGLAAWIYGEFVQRGRSRKGLAAAIAVVILIGGYVYALEDNLQWRSPVTDTVVATAHQENPDGIAWQPWSPKTLADARAAGHPVLVDFTADWCLVCQVNRKTSIEVKPVQQKLKQINAVALEGDDTKLPEVITAELARYGRAGVPLVLVYPADPAAPPQVLPDGYLTPGIVLSALEKAQTPAPTTASTR